MNKFLENEPTIGSRSFKRSKSMSSLKKRQKGKIAEFPQIRTLTPEEKAYLIMLFVEHDDALEIVKEKFEKIAKRKISLSLLVQIRSEHAERIERRINRNSRR